ncbi:hypothetical protein DKT68_19185 [Micromonospora acroterricola]|uniref:Uncharacterized protein n=1 Tax=Micromonospora acroterricola TaxID=2202421 RepID=A0A317CY98_9ACTN|nr:hypothetical protein [Micromonospora acroterricola]PWR07427.1 hypothetical protein DKT68_19185 [Micromonospora acroterricola]
MTVRRRAARLATVCGLLGGLVMLGASPALADDDSVRVGAASSFAAGGSAQGVNVAVRKRSDGCVLLRTALGLRLAGLEPAQVTVQVNAGGRWFPVPVSGGGGSVATGRTSPAKPTLCKGKGMTVRYRVAFAAGAPAGRLAVTGVAVSALGQELGRGADASKVTGGRASASPTPTPSKKPSPTPSVTDVAPVSEVDQAAVGGVSGAPDTTATAAESSGGGSPVMFFGIAMVAVGLLLIVLLFRRSRQDRKPADELSGPLPGNPGGTTYRSGGGSPPAPGHPGPVYGQQQPSAGYGAVPAPRPATGGVYGAPPAAPSPAPDATQPMPGKPGDRPRPDDPPADGGDHTVFMPRLPG